MTLPAGERPQTIKRMLYDGLLQPINGRNHGVLTSPTKDREKRTPSGDD